MSCSKVALNRLIKDVINDNKLYIEYGLSIDTDLDYLLTMPFLLPEAFESNPEKRIEEIKEEVINWNFSQDVLSIVCSFFEQYKLKICIKVMQNGQCLMESVEGEKNYIIERTGEISYTENVGHFEYKN